MADRDERRAVAAHLAHVRLALGCVTQDHVRYTSIPVGVSVQHRLLLGDGAPVRLAGPQRIGLSVDYRFAVLPDPAGVFAANRERYEFTIEALETGREILSFHLHVGQPGSPHLHIGSGAGPLLPPLQRAHVPTGFVALEQVLRFLIEDFGVRSLRPDWRAILTPAN